MSLETLKKSILIQKDKVDWVIAEAGRNFVVDNVHKPNLGYDIKIAESEALLLSGNDDLCYDRLSTPLSYSLWYQGKRINAFLSYLSELIFQSRNENSIRIFDLGAGTGAVQCACSLVVEVMRNMGFSVPEIILVNIDTSPLMLNYHNNYVRPLIEKTFPKGVLKCEYHVNSWYNTSHAAHSNNWIVASYLFDHSETLDDVKTNFFELINKFKPNKLILITAYRKKHFVQAISQQVSQTYTSFTINQTGIFQGGLNYVQEFRREISKTYSLNMFRYPQWKDPENWVYAEIFENKTPTAGLDFSNSEPINLYNPSFIVRRDVKLNLEQEKASLHDETRPCLISGPAGCGKSLVISERVKNIIIDYRKKGNLNNLNILLTTFNIKLEDSLRKWIEELLESNNIPFSRDGSKTIVEGFVNDNGVINFMHFDVLPTRLGNIGGQIKFDSYHLEFLKQIVFLSRNIEPYSRYINDISMDPLFLLEEYERVWYGLEVLDDAHYLEISRKGRGHRPLGSNQKKIVAGILSHYEKELIRLNQSSFYLRRKIFLDKIKKNEIQENYSHLIVDEFQDCTQADYSIFYGLLKNNNNLILAGDLAQSVHLGRSSDIPRLDNSDGERMGNRKSFILKGSYRLPNRICECIKPLSEYIINNNNPEGSEMNAFKGAPPGARPIMVYAEDAEQMALKIIDIISTYEPYDIINTQSIPAERITILEKDPELQQKLLVIRNNSAETDSVLKIKGLEKKCIVWSTRVFIDREDELFNYVYTILTRTCSILIIALYPDLKNEVKEVILKLDKKRIIFWDDITQIKYNEL